MRVSDILRHKGTEVVTVAPTTSVEAATRLLGERGIGALVVSTDGRQVAGIVSERDVVRHLASVGRDGLDASVADLMTTAVRTCEPGQSLDELMASMTEGRFRHMPVVVDGSLAGIVSIGDVVARRVAELEDESARLHDYIQTGR